MESLFFWLLEAMVCSCLKCLCPAELCREKRCMKCLPTVAVNLVKDPAFGSHRRCELDWRLDAGSLELYEAPWRTVVSSPWCCIFAIRPLLYMNWLFHRQWLSHTGLCRVPQRKTYGLPVPQGVVHAAWRIFAM